MGLEIFFWTGLLLLSGVEFWKMVKKTAIIVLIVSLEAIKLDDSAIAHSIEKLESFQMQFEIFN
jgi:hypothetical protein